jgi:hypothetical protein
MKSLIILVALILISCQNHSSTCYKNSQTENAKTIFPKRDTIHNKLTVLILPPYDEILNEGISPEIQKYLITEFGKDSSITLLKFPYKELNGIPYYMVFDKKFCKPIIDNVNTDIILMSKLDLVSRTESTQTCKWKVQFRNYNVRSDIQINSSVLLDSLTDEELKAKIHLIKNQLIKEIINNH